MVFPFKRALVTGGAGFIGSHLIDELLKQGVECVSFDNYATGKKENLDTFRDNELFTEIEADVVDKAAVEAAYEGVDVVFHNAASKKAVCLIDPRKDLSVNAEGTFNMLDAALRHKVKKFVHASTGSVYGEPKIFPSDESHPLRPISFYGVSKLAGERYVDVFRSMHKLNTTILRYFHVYGPRQEFGEFGGVIGIFNRRLTDGKPPIIYGDGTQQRSFTYVGDVVRANILAATNLTAEGRVFNCASGIQVTINELAAEMSRMYGRDVKPIYKDWLPGDAKKFDIDNSAIRKLGLDTFTPFSEGLKTTVAWYRDYFS